MSLTNIVNWKEKLKTAKYDSNVNIKIVEIINGEVSTYITAIEPKKMVKAHYHPEGQEHYHIISGRGIIRLKSITGDSWEQYDVAAGESFVINPNVIHELSNVGDEELVLMFSCKSDHLQENRIMV